MDLTQVKKTKSISKKSTVKKIKISEKQESGMNSGVGLESKPEPQISIQAQMDIIKQHIDILSKTDDLGIIVSTRANISEQITQTETKLAELANLLGTVGTGYNFDANPNPNPNPNPNSNAKQELNMNDIINEATKQLDNIYNIDLIETQISTYMKLHKQITQCVHNLEQQKSNIVYVD